MDKMNAVKKFIERVNYLPDTNYGDFKRKLDLATTQLWQTLGHENKEIEQTLWQLKSKTVYGPHTSVDEARMLALDSAAKIKTLLH